MQLLATYLLIVWLRLGVSEKTYWWLGTNAFGGQNDEISGELQELEDDKQEDLVSAGCPVGWSCIFQAECSSSVSTSGSGIQERIANFVPCSQGKVCCKKHTEEQNETIREPKNIQEEESVDKNDSFTPFQDLPETECPHQMECVQDQFCDQNVSVSLVEVEMTREEKERRGKLIPCMNPATGLFEVCCQSSQSRAHISLTQNDIPDSATIFVKPSSVTKPSPTEQAQKNQKQQTNIYNSHVQAQCPSAMKCVPRDNCDLLGVITQIPLRIPPRLELLRVALMACTSQDSPSTGHVCCRDPDYQYHWQW